MFGGHDDQLDTFLKRGYWYCWEPTPGTTIPPLVKKRFLQIVCGDRIAVKKMLGKGSRYVEIRAIGIVTDVDPTEWRVYVDWLVEESSHKVPINGYTASLHGPYKRSAVEAVFCV